MRFILLTLALCSCYYPGGPGSGDDSQCDDCPNGPGGGGNQPPPTGGTPPTGTNGDPNAFDHDGDCFCEGTEPPQDPPCWGTSKPTECDHHLESGDCNDTNPDINPGEEEIADDGIDQDCDGSDGVDGNCEQYDDDGDGFVFFDNDCDGFGNGNTSTSVTDGDCNVGCWSDTGDDCDDGQADVHPGAIEFLNWIDDDCDGLIDEDGAEAEICDSDEGHVTIEWQKNVQNLSNVQLHVMTLSATNQFEDPTPEGAGLDNFVEDIASAGIAGVEVFTTNTSVSMTYNRCTDDNSVWIWYVSYQDPNGKTRYSCEGEFDIFNGLSTFWSEADGVIVQGDVDYGLNGPAGDPDTGCNELGDQIPVP